MTMTDVTRKTGNVRTLIIGGIVVLGCLLLVTAYLLTFTPPNNASPQASPPATSAPAAPVGQELADDIIAAFRAAGLPVGSPRNNQNSCAGYGCTALVTTDDVSVYVFADDAGAQRFANSAPAGELHRSGLAVVSFMAAQTPEANRPKYSAAADGVAL